MMQDTEDQRIFPRADIKDHWRPTMNLRYAGFVLQQQWVTDDGSKKEWRTIEQTGDSDV